MAEKLQQVSDIFNQLCTEVDLTKKSYQVALISICFNPIFWNIVARTEYSTHFLTKLAGGPKKGCYLLAATIFSLGIFRDYLYEQALREQVTSDLLTGDQFKYLGYLFFGLGNLFVLTSMYALGITGTYLGDYFGILMDERVTGFPFNVLDNPMYVGSTLSFLGTALYFGKPAGLFATLVVHLLYSIALKFEEYVKSIELFHLKMTLLTHILDHSLLKFMLNVKQREMARKLNRVIPPNMKYHIVVNNVACRP